MDEHQSIIPCCPELIEDNHCDVINFSRVLTYPTNAESRNGQQVNVEVILHFKFSRRTLGLTLGDPVYSTTLFPGEKVRLSTTDRRSRFSYDSETKMSYRSEQISEEQYFMTATQKYMGDASAAQSGYASNTSASNWDFHGDANGSISPFSMSADASTNASGKHNSSSVLDYLNQQSTHMQSAATQAVGATHKAHALSMGEVSSRSHAEGESEEHFEASSREFTNFNKCHAVNYMFYRLNKKQQVKFELVAIERRVLDESAPIGGVLQTSIKPTPIAIVPQDIPATAMIKRNLARNLAATNLEVSAAIAGSPASFLRPAASNNAEIRPPIDNAVRQKALSHVDEELMAKNLIDKDGNVTKEIKQVTEFESEFSLPTPGIIVKGCLDECDVCEPVLHERMQLENDLLRKQIELLEKSQEYRCCPVAADADCH
jgi:hypothetical protein